MTSGGARGRSGPAPDPNALRREHDAGDWITLPAEGRSGKPPTWPLTEASERELDVWKREWTRPQATVWEARGQELIVALYVRSVVAAEERTPAERLGLILRFLEDLGISQSGLARNHWRIGIQPQRAVRPTGTEGNSAKRRLKLMAGGTE